GGLVAASSFATSRLLLPASDEATMERFQSPEPLSHLTQWLRGWSRGIALLGLLAFCFTLAEGAALDWAAVYVDDSLQGTAALGAVGLGVFLTAVTAGRLLGDHLIARFGPVLMFRIGVLTAGLGFGVALLIDSTVAGIVGLGLLGAGISYVLPLAISAGSNLPGEEAATAAARVSTLAYLGSFAGPALIGALASSFGLARALALPALLVAITAAGAEAVRPAGHVGRAGAS
ncbi:MAG: MFS transporter, partial [Actinomycetota bacterium]|nr:MFS transporter [Actinomycetota bacterium]